MYIIYENKILLNCSKCSEIYYLYPHIYMKQHHRNSNRENRESYLSGPRGCFGVGAAPTPHIQPLLFDKSFCNYIHNTDFNSIYFYCNKCSMLFKNFDNLNDLAYYFNYYYYYQLFLKNKLFIKFLNG